MSAFENVQFKIMIPFGETIFCCCNAKEKNGIVICDDDSLHMAGATRSHDIVSATTVLAYQERFNIRGKLIKAIFFPDNHANEEQDPIHSSPMPNAEDRLSKNKKNSTFHRYTVFRERRKKKSFQSLMFHHFP